LVLEENAHYWMLSKLHIWCEASRWVYTYVLVNRERVEIEN
jgi:hypothetical protein